MHSKKQFKQFSKLPQTKAAFNNSYSEQEESFQAEKEQNVGFNPHQPHHLTPDKILQLQNSIGNRAVERLLAKNQPSQTSPQPKLNQTVEATAIQRKVFIQDGKNKYRRKTKTTAGNKINGGKDVATMMSDTKSRYFSGKPEFFSYARKETETVGYVDRENTWVRLPNELLVIGEDHTATTLSHLVQATGTDKFMYEFYTEAASNSPKLAQEMEGQKTEKNAEMQLAGTKTRRHEAESFFPKLARALSGIRVYSTYIDASPAVTKLLRLGIFMAAEASAESDTAKFYLANKELLDNTAQALKTNPDVDLEATPLGNQKEKLTQFIALCMEYSNQQITLEQAKATAQEKAAFERSWAPAARDYDADPEAPIMKAEKARDFSLLQHIKQAQKDNLLLFGLGDLHRKRLKPLLDGAGIKHLSMDNFIAYQKGQYPQS